MQPQERQPKPFRLLAWHFWCMGIQSSMYGHAAVSSLAGHAAVYGHAAVSSLAGHAQKTGWQASESPWKALCHKECLEPPEAPCLAQQTGRRRRRAHQNTRFAARYFKDHPSDEGIEEGEGMWLSACSIMARERTRKDMSQQVRRRTDLIPKAQSTFSQLDQPSFMQLRAQPWHDP